MGNHDVKARISNTDLDNQIQQATAAGKLEPEAISASFDTARRRFVVTLADGRSFTFSATYCRELAMASPENAAAVKVSPGGLALHWEALDIDLSVSRLVEQLAMRDADAILANPETESSPYEEIRKEFDLKDPEPAKG